MTKPVTITIELADGDALLAAVVTRAAELLVARLSPEALRRVEEAVDRAVVSGCDRRIDAAVDEVLLHGFAVRDEWGKDTSERVSLVEMMRRYLTTQMDGRQTRLERFIRRAVDEALSGGLGATIEAAKERARALLDEGTARRLAAALRDIETSGGGAGPANGGSRG